MLALTPSCHCIGILAHGLQWQWTWTQRCSPPSTSLRSGLHRLCILRPGLALANESIDSFSTNWYRGRFDQHTSISLEETA